MLYVFYSYLHWGFDGLAWANAIMFFIRFCVSILLVDCGGRFPSFPDVRLVSIETVSNTLPMILIGTKGVFMGVWFWWVYDIFGLMASFLGTDYMAACTVMRNIGFLMLCWPIGSAFACTLYISNSVGSGQANIAMQYYKVAVMCGFFSTSVLISGLYLWQLTILDWFTDHQEVVSCILEAMPMFLIFALFDSL